MTDSTPQEHTAGPQAGAGPPDREGGRHSVVSRFSGRGGMYLEFVGGFSFAGKYRRSPPSETIRAGEISRGAAETCRNNLGGDIASQAGASPAATRLSDCFGEASAGRRRGLGGMRR